MNDQTKDAGQPVNQQMLAALKRMVEVCESPDFDGAPSLAALNEANAAIAAAESAPSPADDLELTLTAENQKRLEVEQQRDQLLAALEKAVGRQAYKAGTGPDWWEQGRAAIAEAKGGAA